MFPYVETVKETPDSGIYQFNDLPRYAMGYASLFNVISFTVETHMLKPFPNRVKATHDFMNELVKWTVVHAPQIELAREKAHEWEGSQRYYKFNYSRSTVADSIQFKGFTAVRDTSEITGLAHLSYDRNLPYQKTIPFYRSYIPMDSVLIPQFYIIRGQERRIIEQLKANNILFDVLKQEKTLKVNAQVVRSFDALSKPYEGHYMHSAKVVEKVNMNMSFRPGDVLVPTNQNGSLFLHAVLQPMCEDSYFTWNYFDSYLQEKEYFSNYVFVNKLRSILQANPDLKQEYEAKKAADQEFATSEWQQLYYIYQHSPYFEPSYMMLPVFELK